ncbi:MAG: heavy metal translocating P-type ATPase [Gammaproteobacteria bacterium]|nr:heavy metal translocating P-type ATPase [Gammaproteobacteria bacterium]
MTQPQSCFHCGEPVPTGLDCVLSVEDRQEPFCCLGCRGVCEAILDAGLGAYYRARSGLSARIGDLVPDCLQAAELYDRPELQQRFVAETGEGLRETTLLLSDVTCAACVWLLERHVGVMPGVSSFSVNLTSGRGHLVWLPDQISLSRVLLELQRIGFVARPYEPGLRAAALARERKSALMRIGVAGFGTMQVMMLAVGEYLAGPGGMDATLAGFFNRVSLLLAGVVLCYAGQPFLTGAWRSLRRGWAVMDLPVAVALVGAYAISFWHVTRGQGPVYFDSVVMFIFFLSLGRYAEAAARRRASAAVERLAGLEPERAERIRDGLAETVLSMELQPGDRVRVRPGQRIPADGRVVAGRSAVDESLLTGESRPVVKRPGDPVIGGAYNRESPLELEVERVGAASVLGGIRRMLDAAQSEKPRVARVADRIAAIFIVVVLLVSAGAAVYWWQVEPERAVSVVLAVLVASCPCALALATPAALTAVTSRLLQQGVLVTRTAALETLAGVEQFLFDKTGTLTMGRPRLAGVTCHGDLTEPQVMAVAGALEQGSEHPLATALAADGSLRATALENHPGAGVEGRLAVDSGCPGLYRLGRAGFCGVAEPTESDPGKDGATRVYLVRDGLLQAEFRLIDPPRPGAVAAVQGLRDRGVTIAILSGDGAGAVLMLARRLGLTQFESGLSPADKLERLSLAQADGQRVAMVGDGINDAPVLAAADVAIAMGGGTLLAQRSADLILLENRIDLLPEVLQAAGRLRWIVRQNLVWAVSYNLAVLPLAVSGVLAPWMAAIGMPLSSLLVVLNALRLARGARAEEHPEASEWIFSTS